MGAELPSVRYRDAKGRPKLVRYWAMTVEREVERPADHEVDEVRWLPRDRARERLTYPHDRTVLDALDPSS
jgi:8-oxo-dGTP diphosphatase